jgi:hypothetical protein
LDTKIASHMLVLTLPLSAVAHHTRFPPSPLPYSPYSSPNIANKAALLTFPNGNRFRPRENSG